MKKAITAFLILVLTLTACGNEPTVSVTDVDTARSFSKYDIELMAESEDSLYFNRRTDLIYYIDKATGTGGPLCGKPECRHNDNTCNAFTLTYSGEGAASRFGGGDGNAFGLYAQNGRLYWAVSTGSEGVTIYSSALDGTDHQKLGCLGRDLTPHDMNNSFVTWSDKYAFLSCKTTGVEDAVTIDHNYVCAIPLNPEEGEPTVILSERVENYSYMVPMQVYGGYLYFITCNLNSDFSETEKNGAPWITTFTIYRWNMETQELETVFEDPDSGVRQPFMLWVTDNYILFNDLNKEQGKRERVVDRYDFETGECGRLFELGISYTEGTLGTSFGSVDFGDGIVVGSKLLTDDETNSFQVIIKDFDGNTLVDDTYRPEPGDGILADKLEMNGADRENVYFTLYTNLDNSKTKVTFITVALDGSGARTLGTLELPGY